MEFTPKKQIIPSLSAVRHTPYASGGQSHYKRLRRINPPGSPRSSSPGNSNAYAQKRFCTDKERINLTARIVHDPKAGSERKIIKSSQSPKTVKCTPLAKIIKSSPSPQSTKRPFSAVNSVESVKENGLSAAYDRDSDVFEDKKKPSDENDPYNFCASLDLDVYDKRTKTESDKENNTSLLGLPRITAVKSYPSKKKQLDVSRSRLLADISLDKVEKAYGVNYSKSEAEKENVPTETTSSGELVPLPESTPVVPHLIGFPNYGNTCYLNSVIQALFGLSPFVDELQTVSPQLNLPTTSLSSGLNQVIGARTKGQVPLVKQSLRTVKENLVRVDGSFSGYKMQDANEFLTRILDTIKDEIDRCNDMTTSSPDQCVTSSDEFDKIFPHKKRSQDNGTEDNNFESELSICTKDESPKGDRDSVKRQSEVKECCACNKESVDGESDPLCVSPSHTHSVISTNKGCDDATIPRNPIKDNFEFQLFESYRCDGCNEVEGKKQEYFGLYVNLPEENGESIQEALSSCMGEDERELKCNKCGHNRSSVVTSITRLPRILIVQLKRYEYKPEQGESVKRSWRVPVTRWLHLDKYVSDVSGPPSWNPNSGTGGVPKASKPITLTVRNLSSELNVCEGRKEQEESPVCSPSLLKCPEGPAALPSDKEDDELQEVMRRSMDDIEGTREEEEIQQAIRLSLQDLGMSYAHENQTQGNEDEVENEESQGVEGEEKDEDEVSSHDHSFRLISVISHFGCTTNTGHYVADVYNCEEKSWFHYDDETVSKIPESVVLADGRHKNGYIFFYVHKDVFLDMEKKVSLQR